MLYTRFHVSNIKLTCYSISRKQQVRSSGQITNKVSSRKNTLTVDTDDQQFNFWWTFTNRQSKTNRQVEFERQAKEPTLSLIKLTFIYTNFLHFECDRFKVVDYFSSSTAVVNCQLLNILIKVSTQSISWAMAKNANFLKSCQLLLYVEFA